MDAQYCINQPAFPRPPPRSRTDFIPHYCISDRIYHLILVASQFVPCWSFVNFKELTTHQVTSLDMCNWSNLKVILHHYKIFCCDAKGTRQNCRNIACPWRLGECVSHITCFKNTSLCVWQVRHKINSGGVPLRRKSPKEYSEW